jgi:NADH:ubiquinone oxidoreductase subunit 6 (subunit J)
MTSQQLTALAIKILGIWLLVHVVLYLPSLWMLTANLSNFTDSQIPASLSVVVFVGFLTVGLVVSLIMFHVSKSVLSGVPESKEKSVLSPTFVLQITGLFFIVSALTVLPGHVLSLSKQTTIELSNYAYLAGYVFKISIGAYLLIKPTVWAHWLNKFRGRV